MKTLLVGIVGADNFGDEAMFKVAYKSLKEQGKDILVLTYNVHKASQRFSEIEFIQMPSFSKSSYLTSLFGRDQFKIDVSNFDALYVAGGGNLNSNYTSHVLNMYLLTKKFKNLKKYVEFRPQSIGPFYGKSRFLIEYLVKNIVKYSDRFYVRELLSLEYLKSKGIETHLQRDDAWNLEIDSSIQLPSNNYVGICIRPWKEMNLLTNYVQELTKRLIRMNFSPLFIPIAYGGNKKYIDNVFLKGKVEGVFLDDLVDVYSLTPEKIKGIISKCIFTIGMSYHFNVFSLSSGVPSGALYMDEYYKIKNLGLYKAFGNPDLVFKVPDTPVDVLVQKILSITR